MKNFGGYNVEARRDCRICSTVIALLAKCYWLSRLIKADPNGFRCRFGQLLTGWLVGLIKIKFTPLNFAHTVFSVGQCPVDRWYLAKHRVFRQQKLQTLLQVVLSSSNWMNNTVEPKTQFRTEVELLNVSEPIFWQNTVSNWKWVSRMKKKFCTWHLSGAMSNKNVKWEEIKALISPIFERYPLASKWPLVWTSFWALINNINHTEAFHGYLLAICWLLSGCFLAAFWLLVRSTTYPTLFRPNWSF